MIIFPKLKIGYQDIPKVASTSLFNWLFASLYGRPYDPNARHNSNSLFIHSFFRSGKCSDAIRVANEENRVAEYPDCFRFCITRDPVKRFLSMYSNRVLHLGELGPRSRFAPRISESGLELNPEINALVDKLDAYMNCQPSIFHHARPMIDFLGLDPGVHGRFADISEVNGVIDEIKDFWLRNGIAHHAMKLKREQTGGRKISLSELSPGSFEKLLVYYSEDYEKIPSIRMETIKEEYYRSMPGRTAPESKGKPIPMDEKTPQKPEPRDQRPFIIWTFRRTGGTNLGSALFEKSPFRGVKHEPFNPDRIFGSVTTNWLKNKDLASLHAELTAICKDQVLMKHCVEIIPTPLSLALAEVSAKLGYRHLFLFRRQPVDRLLSLHFAQKSGAWGKDQVKNATITDDIFQAPLPIAHMVSHELHCRKTMQAIFDHLCQSGAKPLMLAFEDLYTNNDLVEAKHQIRTVLKAFGLSRGEAEDAHFLDQVLTRGDQGTRNQYTRFADYGKLVDAMAKLGEFSLQEERLPRFWISHLAEPQPEILKTILWDPRPDVQVGSIVVSGTVVLAPEAPAGCRLLIEDADGCRVVQWGLESPRMAARFPGNENAAYARFRAEGVRMESDKPAFLMIEFPGKERRMLASIHMRDNTLAESIPLKSAGAGSK